MTMGGLCHRGTCGNPFLVSTIWEELHQHIGKCEAPATGDSPPGASGTSSLAGTDLWR